MASMHKQRGLINKQQQLQDRLSKKECLQVSSVSENKIMTTADGIVIVSHEQRICVLK